MAYSASLKDYVDKLTECPICLEDLVNPKSLPCVHTFCVQCIRDHCKDSLPGARVNCPVCRSPFVIPGGGVEQLPNNFMLQGLADAKKASSPTASPNTSTWRTSSNDTSSTSSWRVSSNDTSNTSTWRTSSNDTSSTSSWRASSNDTSSTNTWRAHSNVSPTSSESGDSSESENEVPILRHRFPAGDPVVALTCLGDELFVLRYESRQEIRIYYTLNFTFKGILRVECLSDDTRWCGMTSCAANDCIYVSDSFKDAVYRVHSETEEIWTWNVDSRPNGLSSTKSSNIVIAYFKASKLQEYTRNGSLVREICLQGDVFSPVHAILWKKGKFVVSHHGRQNGVSIVDTTGRVLASYMSFFNYQRNLAVDQNGFVMVANSSSNGIRVVDPNGHSVSDLFVPISGGLNDPWSLCYDESQCRLYIGEYDGKRVVVFDNVVF